MVRPVKSKSSRASSPLRIDTTLRPELLRHLHAAAEGIKDQPWPAASRNKALQEAVPYDRRRAAKDMLKLEDVGLHVESRKALATYADALARALPESLEDLDGTDVLEWLEHEVPITWSGAPLAGHSPRSERPYSAEERFEIGDVLVHAKFGRGVVIGRTDTALEVRFAEGSRKLGSRRPSA